jgi:hypothetical protein
MHFDMALFCGAAIKWYIFMLLQNILVVVMVYLYEAATVWYMHIGIVHIYGAATKWNMHFDMVHMCGAATEWYIFMMLQDVLVLVMVYLYGAATAWYMHLGIVHTCGATINGTLL